MMGLSQREQQMAASIVPRREQMVRDLARLVAIPTGRGNEQGLDECRGVLVDRLQRLGAAVQVIQGSPRPAWLRESTAAAESSVPPVAILRRDRADARVRVLLCGHIDTVFGIDAAFDSLTISSDGARATGPGCADMKGGLLVAINALEAVEAAGVPIAWTFVLVSDEETGSFHADAALRAEASKPRAAGGYDAGLVFEPALPDGGLVVERPGSGQFMIECCGRAAHVGRDFTQGISAVRALAGAITRASDLADPANGSIVSIGPVEGGSATNIVPDTARCWGNVRFFSATAEHRLAAALDAMNSPGESLPRTRVVRVFNRPAKNKTAGVERLASLTKVCAADLGQQLPFGTTGGVCDGNNIQAGGLPTIDTLGVRGGGLHTTQEWIELDSLVQRTQVSAVLLSRLSEGALG